MANEKILNTKIKLRYDSHESWMSNDPVLMAGELALSTVTVKQDGVVNAVPSVLIKCGDGTHKYSELDYVFARAADVIAEAKSAETLEAFVTKVIGESGIATDEVVSALAERVTTAEGEIDTLQSEMDAVEKKAADNAAAIEAIEAKFGEDTVALEISKAIAALNLADTYAAKTHGHEIAEVNGLSDAIAAAKKAGTDANAALEAYKTLNDAAVKVNSDAIAAIKNGETLDNFKEVEEALAGKQAAGDYSVVGHKHEIADVNGLETAIADAKKAGTDAADAAGKALTDAKAYTDSEMTRLVGDTKVATQITNAITGLDLANTYDAKGAAADAEAAAKEHATGLNTAMNARVEALEAIDHDHGNKGVLDGITAEKVAAWDAAEQNAKDHADDLDEAMDLRMQAVEAKLGTGEDGVDAQIAAAVAAEAALREAADADLQGQIGVASAEGVTATGLHAKIEAVDAELERLTGGEVVAEAISTAVKAEEDRAKGIEAGLESRLAAVEGDYLKAADKTELEGKIQTNASAIELLTNGVKADEVDGVNDLIKYVKEHGTEVTGIKADIKTNADDIDALEGRMDAAEGAIALKAAQADLEAAVERIAAVEGDLNTEDTGLKARMTQAEADIDALEGKVGDKTVAEQIEAAVADAKTDASNKDAVVLAEAQKGIAAVDGRVVTLETEIVKKANDADLAAVAKSGLIDDLSIGEGTVLLFDCGGAN